jgi:hypothetical protein
MVKDIIAKTFMKSIFAFVFKFEGKYAFEENASTSVPNPEVLVLS